VTDLPYLHVRVFRVVAALWLVGWYWKTPYFADYYLSEIWTYPVRYSELPRVLVHPATITIAWVSPILVVVALVVPRRATMRAAAVLMTLAALVGCLHFETFYDATFVTSFWTGAWLVWFTANVTRSDTSFHLHARVLAQCTIALVFLGGAVGKLTGAYLMTGDALYHLYFLQKPSWPYPWLRGALSPEALHAIATWLSRAVVGVELLLALSPLARSRVAAIGGIAIMSAMVVVSTWYLLSVMACLIGLCIAVLLLDRAEARFSHATQ
jgi:hypothetical protein